MLSKAAMAEQGKQERIDERRRRIDAKRQKDGQQPQDGSAPGAEQAAAVVSASKRQVGASRAVVDAVVETGAAVMTDVRVEADAREDTRRRREANNRRTRVEQVEAELVQSRAVNAEIEQKWAAVAKLDVPQDLYREIALQYQAASNLIAGKAQLIEQLVADLRAKDAEYVELLAQHQEDVETLARRMQEQFAALLATCKRELRAIDEAFVLERRALLDANKAAVDALFAERRKIELGILDHKTAREDAFQDEMTQVRARFAEDFNTLKITLENNIQLLEQQLEQMRATYQLNTEKLEYNHAVLEERDTENKQTVEHHRQRLRRLKEALGTQAQKFAKQDARFKQENDEITDEFKRVTEQFKDLQAKFRHFELMDAKTYQQLWSMNEQNVMSVVKKVLAADKVVHEQILGLNWQLPYVYDDLDKMRKRKQGQAVAAALFADKHASSPSDTAVNFVEVVDAQGRTRRYDGNAAIAIEDLTSDLIANTNIIQSTTSSSSSGGGGDASKDVDSDDEGKDATADGGAGHARVRHGRFSQQKIQTVLSMLSDEVAFLVDAKVEEGLQGMSDDEKCMYQVDSILSALGVEDHDDVEELVAFFYEDEDTEVPVVHPNDIVKVLRDYVLKHLQKEDGAQGSSGAAASSTKIKADVLTEKKRRRRGRERELWKKLQFVVGEDKVRVWQALERGLVRYNQLLEERSGLIDETTELARQNDELKVLLQEYLGSKINEELVIPPTRLLRVD